MTDTGSQKVPHIIKAIKSDYQKKELTVNRIKTDTFWDSHWHDYFEIKLILSGNGTVVLNGKRFEFDSGSLYFVVPSNIHQFIPNGNVELYTVTIRESLLLDELIIKRIACISELFFKLDRHEFSHIVSLFELLEAESTDKSDYSEQMTMNLLECLLIMLIRKSPDLSVKKEKYVTGVQIAVSYMRIHFREKLTAASVASVAGFNASYFSALFHKSTGKTFSKYLNDLRLTYAERLLSYSELFVIEVCRESGFNSYSNFLKSFRKNYGCSPKAIRKKNSIQ